MQVFPTTDSVSLDSATLDFFQLSLNTDLLSPIAFESSIPGATGSVVSSTLTSATLSLLFAHGLTFTGSDTLGVLRCIARVSDTTTTTVALQRGSIVSSDSACITQVFNEDGHIIFVTLYGCGTSTVSDFMKGKLPMGIAKIYPNPASDYITVSFRNELKRPIQYELLDALGIVRFHNSTLADRVTLDVSKLANGVYIFLAIGDDGSEFSRSVVVSR